MRFSCSRALAAFVLPVTLGLASSPLAGQSQTFPPAAPPIGPDTMDLPPLEAGPGQLPLDILIALGLEAVPIEKGASSIPGGARWWIRQPDGRRLLVSGGAVAARAESPVFLRPVLAATPASRRAKVDVLGVEDTVIAAVRPIPAGRRYHYAAVPTPGYVVEGVWHVRADRSLSWLPASGVVSLRRGEVLVPDVVPQEAILTLQSTATPWIADPYMPPPPVLRAARVRPRKRVPAALPVSGAAVLPTTPQGAASPTPVMPTQPKAAGSSPTGSPAPLVAPTPTAPLPKAGSTPSVTPPAAAPGALVTPAPAARPAATPTAGALVTPAPARPTSTSTPTAPPTAAPATGRPPQR